MPVTRNYYPLDVYFKFKVSNDHAHPENVLQVILNQACLNKLGWTKDTKVKVFVPAEFSWVLFLMPHPEGYKYSTYKNKVFFRFKWDPELPSPKHYLYNMQKSEFVKAYYNKNNICILDMTKNHTVR